MKQVTEVMKSMGNLPSAEPVALPQIDDATAAVVNRLFKELKSIFPAWKQAWPTDADLAAAKKSWIKGFVAAGISQIEQIRFGIENCRQLGTDFIPSVGRFIKLCQPTPEMLGIPSCDAAYSEAVMRAHPSMGTNQQWSHPAVYHAAAETGFHKLSTLPADVSRKLFDRNYEITTRLLLEGKPLRTIPLALPERVVGRITPAVGNAALATLRKNRGGHAHG